MTKTICDLYTVQDRITDLMRRALGVPGYDIIFEVELQEELKFLGEEIIDIAENGDLTT